MNNTLTYDLKINGEIETVTAPAQETLLTVLRERLHLTGAKRGCDQGVCGTCTVLINGEPMRGCLTIAALCEGAEITTIEGLASAAAGSNPSAPDLTVVQQAWIDHQVPQCGYCQSGMIMAVSSLLAANPNPSDTQIDQSITNICRCGSYPRVRKAIRSLTA